MVGLTNIVKSRITEIIDILSTYLYKVGLQSTDVTPDVRIPK